MSESTAFVDVLRQHGGKAAASQPREAQREPRAPRNRQSERIIICPGAPFDVAQEYGRRQHVTTAGLRTLHHHRNEFLAWNKAAFEAVDDATMRAWLYNWLSTTWERDGEGKLHQVKPKPSMVSAVADALRAAAHLETSTESPGWLSQPEPYPAHQLLPCQNGLLHWPSGQIVPTTPAFFTTNALDFSFDPQAPEPAEWLRFLRDLWPNDQESVDTLQETFGLALAADTTFQKIIMLVGPKRSGKGTIARILTKLVGSRNVAAPTLSSLGTEFGAAPLIHKTVAIIGDARIGPKTDTAAIAERLLSISGEDLQQINRKHTHHWIGQLKVRFFLISNELPRFNDTSGALAGRFVILSLRRSFYGQEDLGLLNRLLPELPGILNWAIVGLKRLKQRGYFITPAASREQADELDTLASPMRAFIRDTYEAGDGGAGVLIEDFCAAWRAWCAANHRDHPGTNQAIGAMLRTAAPYVTTAQLRSGPSGQRQRWFLGIRAKR